MSRHSKPSISIIGAGRLGAALAIALRRSGYPIVGLVARHHRKAEKVARLLTQDAGETAPLAIASNESKRLPSSDLILISTPDDEIAGVAQKLSRETHGSIVFHTSGALSSEVLAPLKTRGISTGSIHPLISVSEAKAGAEAFQGAFFCIEGDNKALRTARRIVSDLGGTAFSIPSHNKALYHAAAVIASPHATSLFDVAVQTLVAAGLTRNKARQVLVPLLQSTVRNLETSDAASALTGTFARGDVATVKRHLKALSGREHSQALQIYKLLGLHALRLAQMNGLDRKLTKEITKLLS